MDRPVPSNDADRRKEILSLAAEHDRFDMAAVIEGTPEQIAYALSDSDLPTVGGRDFERAVVVAMGGSALPVEALQGSFVGRFRAPVTACRDYGIPWAVDERTLVIGSSFSGETEETVSVLERLPADAANVAVVTTGGELAKLAQERGYPIARIPAEREPANFQPRCATGYGVTYLARILASAGILEEPAPMLEGVVAFLRGLDVRSEAESAAYWLGDRIPVFYTETAHGGSIARIAKIKVNENAKRPAFFNCLPEANHNEMIGFSRPLGRFACLYLRDPDGHPRVHLRFEAMRTVFRDRHIDHIDFREWTIPGATPAQKVFAGIAFADWMSYSRALLDGQDPTPVDLVQDFKEVLGEGAGV